MSHTLLRYRDGLWPNVAALGYALGGWAGGLVLCAQAWPVWNALGVLLLAHALVIAAYLLHECAHNTIFKESAHNARLGVFLGWITGACYAPYEEVRHKHFRHHIDNADVVALDHRGLLLRHPWLRKAIVALEWLYVPALDLTMHALVIALPLVDDRFKYRRVFALRVLLARLVLFGLLALWSFKALLLYGLAYMLFLHVMRFMDVHQHTYVLYEALQAGDSTRHKGDREYEQANTYSNLISTRHPWLNLLTLNFPYHNAHHEKPAEPWYRLPVIHRRLFGDDHGQVLPIRNLLHSYHHYRLGRILAEDMGEVGSGRDKGKAFAGAAGVSFLVAH